MLEPELVPNEHVAEYQLGVLGGYFQKVHEVIDRTWEVPAKPPADDEIDDTWFVTVKRQFIAAVSSVSDDTAKKAHMIEFFRHYFHVRVFDSPEWGAFFTEFYATVAKRFPTEGFQIHKGVLTSSGCVIEAVVENGSIN